MKKTTSVFGVEETISGQGTILATPICMLFLLLGLILQTR